jgi:predicted pyridoxine 5'-phosphate oxidase superfamily flavin-nucleotide-binding protein
MAANFGEANLHATDNEPAMTNPYFDIAFTETVKEEQRRQGSRHAYANAETRDRGNDRLGPNEAEFIQARDGFYLATVNNDGWPYIQFRGGPAGFVKVLDDKYLAFADLRGNRQYVSTGNVAANPRVAMFFMDYANQQRLKLYAKASVVQAAEASDIISKMGVVDTSSPTERVLLLEVQAFDWNCPQHITPRFTIDEINRLTSLAINGD